MFTTTHKIRNAEKSEFPTLASIEIAAGKRFFDEGVLKSGEGTTPTAANYQDGTCYLVEHATDGPVGFIQVFWHDRFLHIQELSVHPDHQRKGIGAALIAHTLDLARQKDALGLTLSTFRDVSWNGPYYEQLGFEAVSAVGLGKPYVQIREREHANSLDITARQIMIYHL